jgi:hypothetical protein
MKRHLREWHERELRRASQRDAKIHEQRLTRAYREGREDLSRLLGWMADLALAGDCMKITFESNGLIETVRATYTGKAGQKHTVMKSHEWTDRDLKLAGLENRKRSIFRAIHLLALHQGAGGTTW